MLLRVASERWWDSTTGVGSRCSGRYDNVGRQRADLAVDRHDEEPQPFEREPLMSPAAAPEDLTRDVVDGVTGQAATRQSPTPISTRPRLGKHPTPLPPVRRGTTTRTRRFPRCAGPFAASVAHCGQEGTDKIAPPTQAARRRAHTCRADEHHDRAETRDAS